MKKYHFDCGCSFPIDESLPPINGMPSLIYDLDLLPMDCPITWELISSGMTKGIFQLESPLGRQWAKKLKPNSIEHLSALGALLRPGCVSGDTYISTGFGYRQGRNIHYRRIRMRDLYDRYSRSHALYENGIVSLNETTNQFFNNKIEDMVYSGRKRVYQPLCDVRGNRGYSDLECTLDHPILTHDKGWVELQHLQVGDRIAIKKCKREGRETLSNFPGEKSFRYICRHHYKYKCIFCDWREGSLDVNHLVGNRKTDNSPGNLCFLCPNHHRLYSEGKISKAMAITARKSHTLRNSHHIQWVEYTGKKYLGVKDTYDISVEGPNHNFIAGNVVVHNCLKAKDEAGISMTEHFCLRKNGEEEVSYYVPALEPILNDTYGILAFQEQAMDMAVLLAGFNPQEADSLRKAMGKKDTKLMAKNKTEFLEKAKQKGVLTDEQAESIFANIEKSQRYSFNRSHSVSYGLIGYHTAHMKAHFPLQFFTSYLFNAKEKQDPLEEINELVNDARAFNYQVLTPNFSDLEFSFNNDGKVIKFGLADIKGVGYPIVTKMRASMEKVEDTYQTNHLEWGWFDFLIYFSEHSNSGVTKKMISAGALSDYKIPRQRMLAEFGVWKSLTDKEREKIIQMKLDVAKEDESLFPKNVVEPPTDLIDGIEKLLSLPKGVANKNRRAKVESLLTTLKKPPRPLEDTPGWIAEIEDQLLGIPITHNRADGNHESMADTTCKQYRDGKDEKTMRFGVDIQKCREITIQKGDNRGRKMCFLTVSDKTGSIDDVTMFSEVWEKYANSIDEGNTVEIRGHRDPKRGSLIVDEVIQL